MSIDTNNTTTTVNVDFQQLANASKELSAISSEMKEITERMSNIIQEISNVWQDENGKAFVSKFEMEVQSKFDKYYNSVQAYSDFIKGAHDAYLNYQETTKSSVQGS